MFDFIKDIDLKCVVVGAVAGLVTGGAILVGKKLLDKDENDGKKGGKDEN